MPLEIIQIIEDEPLHAQLLDHTLREARYRTNVAHHALTGLDDVRRLNPALILLDVMLPEIDGYEVCRRLRDDPGTQATPIIMISALGGEEHRLGGFRLGADDYVVKPFSPGEVLARVEAVLRRSRAPAASKESYLNGQLILEESRFVVSLHGQAIQLSGLEWWLLRYLAREAGRLVSREELIAHLWGEDGLIHDHELDRQIQQLGRKLNDGALCAGSILRAPGGGYRLSSLRP
ncbi:MAG: response regulator transcription factor [Nitrospirota bacterium]